MTTATQNRRMGTPFQELAADLRRDSRWLLAFGIIQIIVGLCAVSFSFSATIASVVTLGVLLIIASGVQTAAAFLARSWSGFSLFLLLGILYGAAGFLSLVHPVEAAEGLTLMLSAAFLVGGMFRIVVSLVERFSSWGWVLFNGIVTLLLGIAIFKEWPASGLWVLGMFVGIDLIMNGVTWLILAVGIQDAVPE